MPATEAPVVELGSAPQTPSIAASSPSVSESSTSTPEPQNIRPTPLFRALAMPPPEPEQPLGQEELERRLPGYRRIVIPRDLTLIELLKQDSGATTDEEVLRIREAKLRVVADRVGLRRLNVLAPRLRSLTLDGSALSSLRDLGIGLVHLKVLSVKRCGLTCLDGVWGLSALKELHVAGNRLQDLHPLAALQKLHTLDLSDNPVEAADRLWTLGVCGALRNLTLKGTPIFYLPHYRELVAQSLPMLTTLDGQPMYEDEDIIEDERLDGDSCSESEGEITIPKVSDPCSLIDDPEPGPSSSVSEMITEDQCEEVKQTPKASISKIRALRRRPATTEAAGVRPPKLELQQRPKTALDRPNIDAPTRLQILNSLMDEEWRCSGSRLTSNGPVCGNLARALRRPSTATHSRRKPDIEAEMAEETIEDACQAVADEIPRVPWREDWAKFRETTGIDIDIDFNQQRPEGDPLSAIERLEKIEKETLQRFQHGHGDVLPHTDMFQFSMTVLNNPDMWKDINVAAMPDPPQDLDSLFNVIRVTNRD